MEEKIINEWKLDSGLRICHIEKFRESFNDFVRKYFDENYPMLRWRNYLSEDEAESVNKLNSKLDNKERISVGIFKDDEIVGWSYGWQGGMELATYYMANSCIMPEYRRQGLYSLLIEKVIEIAKAKSFHTLTSRHVASNNPVLIAKLKAGFKISGVEFSELYGSLVHLTYFNNDLGDVFLIMKKSELNSTLNGNRISLNKHKLELAESMFNYVDKDRERLRQFLPWVDFVKTLEDEINYIKDTHKRWTEFSHFDFGLFAKEENVYMGNIGVHTIDWGNNCCELGYWILGDFEGHKQSKDIYLKLAFIGLKSDAPVEISDLLISQ